MLHLITYDLHKPGQNYEPLCQAIAAWPYVKLTESCWVIRSDLTATQIRNFLTPCIDTNDTLFICDFHHFAHSGLPAWAVRWLSK